MKESEANILEIIRSRRRKPVKSDRATSRPVPFHDDEYVHLIAENARDLILHAQLKPQFRFDYVSPSATRITGYTPEDFYADHLLAYSCIHPDDVKFLIDPASPGAAAQNKPVEIRWICKDGHTIWMEQSVVIALDESGEAFACQIIARDITERKKSEAALLETQQFNASLLENAPHATVVINPDTSIKYVNPAWEKINGWTLQEVVGMKCPYPWWPEQFRDTFAEGFKETLKMPTGNGEVIAQKKNGELYWIDLNWSAVMNNGEILYTLINSIDITERMKSQEALRESESKYRSIFESANDIIILFNPEGKIIDVNSKVKEIAGYERTELLGHTLTELGHIMPKDSLTKILANFQKRLAGQNLPAYEIEMFKKNGEPITYELNAEVLKNNDKVTGDLAILRDITLQKRSMLAIKESEEKFSKTFVSSPYAVCIVSIEKGCFIEVNESFTRFTGYSREEAVNHNANDLSLWLSDEEASRIDNLMKSGKKIYNEQFQSRSKSGEIRTGMMSAEIIDIGGKKCMILVINDISEQVKAQKALVESEEKFAAAFHASPDMIIITDPDNAKYIDVNESFVQNTGYTREELIGHTVTDFDMWVDPAEAETFMRIFQEQGKVRNQVYRFRRKTGEIRTWLCSADLVTIGGQTRTLAVAADITERRKAEEALQESEEKFSKAFYSSPFSVSISQLSDGVFIEVNDRFLLDKGYTREEIIGRSSKNLNIWADRAQAQQIMQTIKSIGKVHNMEIQFLTKSGEVRTGLISADIINIKNEPCMMVINNDITQQKQAEEQLHILSSVTEQISDSTVITDPDFKITYMNQAAEKLFGYTVDEARGKSLNLFNEKPISPAARQAIINTIKKDKVWSGVNVKKHKNGIITYYDCHMSRLYDEKGQPVAYINVQRNITRQKEIEIKLQEHKKLIDSILATMPEGVLVIDSQDRIVLANKAFDAIFHMPRAAMKNNTLGEILPVDRFFDLHKAVKLGAAENNTLEFRYQVQGLDRIIYCIIVKMDGQRTLLTFTDVTAEREKEEKLYLTDRLASLGEMAAGLAHELNNPLTGILALSQMLVSSDLPEEHKEDLECINTEAKRAAGIVRNVLLFARNKTDVNGRSSINDVLTDVLRLREYEQKANNIKVVTELEEDLPEIPIDKGQLQQVFLNLISNAEAAVKKAERPGVITVTTQRTNGHVNILFSDNGCGINKDVMPRIFDPFFTTKEIGKGTGLGLSICYSIIVKHGGKINVKSQENEGTTFTIRMPVVLPEG